MEVHMSIKELASFEAWKKAKERSSFRYQRDKEKIILHLKEKILCNECNTWFTLASIKSHVKTKKHCLTAEHNSLTVKSDGPKEVNNEVVQ